MSQQQRNGDTHEYLCAEFLVQKGGNLVNTPTQKFQHERRKIQHDLLRASNSKTYQRIFNMANSSINKLPRPVGDVFFTESDNNHGEVYDILYESVDGKIKLSCKTSSMEDKSYRFSTKDYIFTGLESTHATYFGNRTNGFTYDEIVRNNDTTIASYQKAIVEELAKIAKSNTDDNETLIKLTKEKVIGHGGYYKTTSKGENLYYPENPINSLLKIDETSVKIATVNSFSYEATIYDLNGKPLGDYEIIFRVKFKDGKNKVGRFLNDIPKGFGATIRLKVLNTYQ